MRVHTLRRHAQAFRRWRTFPVLAIFVSTTGIAETPQSAETISGRPGTDQAGVQALSRVQISGGASDLAKQRDFVAGRIIIGRGVIEASAAQDVRGLLVQEPAVTVTADGRVGLMGLPNYTQFLLDGAPPPAGKRLLDLDLVHVERIEIIKSSVAEFGPFGIAGTINVVTRKPKSASGQSLKVSAANGEDAHSTQMAWSLDHKKPGSPFAFNAQVSAGSILRDQAWVYRTELETPDGDQVPMQRVEKASRFRREHLSLASTVQWQFDDELSVEMSPSLTQLRERTKVHEQSQGGADASGSYPRSTLGENVQRTNSGSLPLVWTLREASGSEWQFSLLPTRFTTDNTGRAENTPMQGTTVTHDEARTSVNQITRGELRYAGSIGTTHDFKSGLGGQVDSERATWASLIDGLPDLLLSAYGSSSRQRSNRSWAYVQDDWRVSKSLAFNLGLRYQQQRASSVEGDFAGTSRFALFAPSVHAAWRLDGEAGKRQIRLGLARTFSAPFLDQLLARPRINPSFPCALGGLCGTNSPDSPDLVGNPSMRPERALGLNASYEQHWGKQGMFNVELYGRRLNDLIGTDLRQSSVAWAAGPRFVQQPVNLGKAWIAGLGLELRLAVQEIDPAWPRLEVRSGLNFSRSRVSTLPGPDNHMADQHPWGGKLGLRYKLETLPLDLGLDANWTDGGWTRSSAALRSRAPSRFNLEAQGAYAVSPDVKLRLTLRNLAPRPFETVDEFATSEGLLFRTGRREAYRSVGVSAELRF